MRTFPDLRMRALVEDAHRAQLLLDQSEHAEARDLFALGDQTLAAKCDAQAVPFAIPATPGPAC